MSAAWLSDNQKIGAAFTAGGIFFFFGGIMMFFDRAMLAMGNILFMIGLTILIGPQKTAMFFARREKWHGTAAFLTGISLILLKWTFFGFIIEGYGLFILFGGFLATIAGFVGSIPVVGPYLAAFFRTISGGRRNAELPV